ncbi:preprotein translocase subunit SecD [Halovivax asiaticus JCM 14624]|uniref:Protein-export membrane protein SecD n=1 Tax=Halovivax asiaticus JCM 14624 TaxID=1227490 RepID=M0BL95_9EURY|nr:preprotein translocase subunit SecD [Halovivax asiaticus]ELZ11063.1 preprotein translocase subunit SecD [Halovivax asiaticus JCM 14624]
MSARETFSKWWRIAVLVLLVSVALYALFIPGGMFGSSDTGSVGDANETATDDSLHNLVFGLDLDGGARISAPATGMTVDDVTLDHGGTPEQAQQAGNDLESTLRESFQSEYDDFQAADVTVRYHQGDDSYTVEVFDDNVSAAAFAETLSAEGHDVSENDVEDRVTEETRESMVSVITSKLNQAGLSGGQAYTTETLGGEHYIVAEAPGYTAAELRALLEQRGSIEVRAYVPDGNGSQENITLLQQEDFDTIMSAEYDNEQNQYQVGVTLHDGPAAEFESQMNEIGFTSEGVGQCSLRQNAAGNYDFADSGDQWCLLTMSDGEVVSALGLEDRLATNMRSGEWKNDPRYNMVTGRGEGNEEAAQHANEISMNLQAGALDAPLDFGNAQVMSVQSSLGDQYKTDSLLIGIFAVFAVSGMVYVRYRDPRVALPMILTALSEVVILLGVAAAAEMAITLAHVAGFIAVVGTGVDDLVIIADEVMDEGSVTQARIFNNRFRKAFWTIGAAAATTIIAMSPLAVSSSLGDLQGFAIITILGVLIGVFVTRPAYGSILRKLLTSEE